MVVFVDVMVVVGEGVKVVVADVVVGSSRGSRWTGGGGGS